MHRNAPYRSEEGAALIIALVFVVAIAWILVAIVSLTGTNLADTANLQNERAVEYTADATVDAAVQAVRYEPTPAASSSWPNCWTDTPFSVADPNGSVNGENIVVFCALGATQYQRQVTFTACPSSDSSVNACMSNHDEILVAQVLYSDLSSSCSSGGSGCPAVIGQSATVLSWQVKLAND